MKLLIDKDVKEKHWNQKDKIYGIYIITNLVNGKKYVGQTTNMRKRFSDYNGNKYLTNKKPIYRAIKKYGPDAFQFEAVEILDYPDADALIYLEKMYIKTLKTNKPEYGYNIRSGGDGPNEAARAKMSEVHKGMKESSATKRKKSNTIVMINLDEKIFIVSDSGKLAGDYFGKSKDYIKNCLRHPSSINGYRLYYDDYNKRNEILEKMFKKRCIRDKDYVKLAQYLNSIQRESVETIYESLKTTFDKLYVLSYDGKSKDGSVSLTEYHPPYDLEDPDDGMVEEMYQEMLKREEEDKDL